MDEKTAYNESAKVYNHSIVTNAYIPLKGVKGMQIFQIGYKIVFNFACVQPTTMEYMLLPLSALYAPTVRNLLVLHS